MHSSSVLNHALVLHLVYLRDLIASTVETMKIHEVAAHPCEETEEDVHERSPRKRAPLLLLDPRVSD